MDKSLRILNIMGHFGGGVSTFIYNKALELNKSPIQYDVAMYGDYPDYFVKAIQSTQGEIFSLKNPKKEGWTNFKNSFLLPFKETDYDLICCHLSGLKVLPYYFLAKSHSNAQFVIHGHAADRLFDKGIKSKIKLSIDQMANRFCSHYHLGCSQIAVEATFGENSHHQANIIPNSFDIDRFLLDDKEKLEFRRHWRDALDLSDDEIVVGHIGRLSPVKNHQFTLRLAAYLKQYSSRKYKFLIIGDGPEKNHIKQMIEKKDLCDNVRLMDRQENIEQFYPALDIVIQPSFSEGFGLVAAEAQVAGIPVILSDCVSKEVDLDIGLAKFLSLAELSKWYKELLDFYGMAVPSAQTRKSAAVDKHLSHQQSAELFLSFLEEIAHN